MPDMTASEVADRLGVKLDTVYAYVSRGVLGVRRETAPRRSLFDSDEVDVVARRGRPRRSSRPAAFDLVIETGITTIADHRLRYRGRDALDLAGTRSFEAVAEWLWRGSDQDPVASWEPYPTDIPTGVEHDRDRIRLAVVLSSAVEPTRADREPARVTANARRLIATMVRALTSEERAGIGDGVAVRLTDALTEGRATPSLVRAVEAALVLLADHELASSTVTARVAASVRADPFSVVLAGLGSIAGPLHGNASEHAHRMIDDAVEVGPRQALDSAITRHGQPPGFGHRLYPDGDPRAGALVDLVEATGLGDRQIDAMRDLRRLTWERSRLLPNVDFALGSLTTAGRMPAAAGETIFTIARTAGWLAHALEEYAEPPVRFRARGIPRPLVD